MIQHKLYPLLFPFFLSLIILSCENRPCMFLNKWTERLSHRPSNFMLHSVQFLLQDPSWTNTEQCFVFECETTGCDVTFSCRSKIIPYSEYTFKTFCNVYMEACACACVCRCHFTLVDVRRKFSGAISCPLPCGSRGLNSSHQPTGEPQGHLTSLMKIHFFKKVPIMFLLFSREPFTLAR